MKKYTVSEAISLLNQLKKENAHLQHFKAIKSIEKELGKRNFQVLVTCYDKSKNQQVVALKSVKNGKKCTQNRFNELCILYSEEMNFRQYVRSLRSAISHPSSRKVREQDVRINNHACGIKMAMMKKEARIEGLIDLFVVPIVSGDTNLSIQFVDEPEDVFYRSETSKGDQYSRRCTYRKTDLTVRVGVPRNWWSRVYKQYMDMVDDIFNLDVSTPLKVSAPDGVEIYAATWLVNGRGTERKVVRGFIAMFSDGTSYHAKTMKAALNGLAKKLRIQSTSSLDDNSIIEKAKKLDGILYLSDSYAVGNCVWGTKDFCYRHGIDLNIENPSISVVSAQFST